MKYYTSSGVDICEMPVTDFKVLMVNKPKKSAWSKNYANAGFFGNYGTFTLPAAHLICDFETTNADCKKYCTERGKFIGNKFIFDAGKFAYDKQFYGKSISCMITLNGIAHVEERTNLDGITCNYLIAGIPVIRDGKQVSWSSFAGKQGWTGGECYATKHIFLGIKEKNAKTIYVMGWQSSGGNLVSTGAGYRKFKSLGFYDVIKLDGGGSFMLNMNGTKKYTSENRLINTIVTFGDTATSGGGSGSSSGSGSSGSTGGSTSGSYPVPTRTLTQGKTGTDVKWMQTQLNKAGFKLVVDGSFGPACTYAVKCYQAAKGLQIDGSCGPATRTSLKNPTTAVNPYAKPTGASFSKGTIGNKVKWMQFQLNKWGATTVDLDGSFGPAAFAALKDFQSKSGLEVDGWCGPATREALAKY